MVQGDGGTGWSGCPGSGNLVRETLHEVIALTVRVLGLDPGKTTGYFVSKGYEPVMWGSERDAMRIAEAVGEVDVVVFEDALDLDQVEPLRRIYTVPWVGVTPEQLQRRLLGRVLGRKHWNGPIARREAVRRAFGSTVADPHALDAACLVIWWLTGSEMVVAGAPDLGNLKVWDRFTIRDEFGEETYQVVPPNTADPDAGMVSWASPLVQAVMRAKPGEQVTVQAPGGAWQCTFVGVEDQEE